MRKTVKLLSLIVAVIICVALNVMTSDAKAGEWMQDRIGWWYRYLDGSYPYSGWEYINSDWYYFDENGYRVTGWVKDGSKWYYMLEKGNREETSDMIDQNEGKMLHDVWFGDSDGALYYLQSDGTMKTGWFYYHGEWYYFNMSGVSQKGWQLLNGIWYYLDENRTMVTGWQNIGEKWYYFNESGAMLSGWNLIDDSWYYFYEDGTKAANQYAGISSWEDWYTIGNLPTDTVCRIETDIALEEHVLEIPEGKKIVIDLNGHKIKAANSVILNKGDLTIINSSNEQGEIKISCNKTVDNTETLIAIENMEAANLSLDNIRIEIDVDLHREINNSVSADYLIGGIVNHGTAQICDSEFVLSGLGTVKWYNANLIVYGIENNGVLDMRNSSVSLEGSSFSHDTYHGLYCSCLLFGLYNQSDKKVTISNSDIKIKHSVTSSECSRDKSSAIYNGGAGALELKAVDITSELVNCIEFTSSHISGIMNVGTGKTYISDGKIQVYTVGGNDRDASVYGIYNQNGITDVGTTIEVSAKYGYVCGVYDLSRKDACINIMCATIVAISAQSKNAYGIETSSRSVAEVKIGNPNDFISTYPNVFGTSYAVKIGSGSQICYICSGVYGCNGTKQIFGVDFIYPKGSKTMSWIKNEIAYLSLVPESYVKWLKNERGWWYQRVDGSYPCACWQNIDDVWYFFDEVGYMVTGWKQVGETWYYFKESGAMATGWQLVGSTWYYFHTSGAMAASQWVGNYYLQADGSMATNKWIGKYYVGANGCWIP